MQELSNNRSYLIMFVLYLTFSIAFTKAQLTGSVFDPHAQLLQSFQNEMKSLEAAAHRVNALLMNPNLSNSAKQTDDQIAENTIADSTLTQKELKDKPFEVTVLGDPNILRNGILKMRPQEPVTTKSPEIKQQYSPNPLLNFGPFGSLFSSLNTKSSFPTPWWRGQNVCIEKTDKVEDEENNGDARNKEPQFLIFGTGSFERCRQTANKYVCTTVLSTPESSKTSTVTYECCEGFRREGNACVEGDNTMEKISSISDDTSSSSNNNDNNNDDEKSEMVAGNNVENNNFQYVPFNVTISNPKKTTEKKEEQSVDKSYSSQSEEEDVNLKSLVESLNELGATQFVETLKATGLVDTLASRNVTVFAPVTQETNQQPSAGVRKLQQRSVITETWNDDFNMFSPAKEIALAHVTDSLLEIEDFSNEMVLNSINNKTLRFNVYPGRLNALVTVNCARLTSWDNLAKNSRIHTIDRSLDVFSRSVLDILQQPQFSQFRMYLEQADLISRIENASSITVFAPTNDAWEKLDENLKAKYARGEGCLDTVLKHHILPLTLCSVAATEGRLTTTDISGELIRISTNDEGNIVVDKRVRVVGSDVVGVNGVVHVIESVLIPQSAKSLSDLLSYSNHTTFLGLLNKAGLTEEFNKADNLTLFVPTEKVLNEPDTKELLQNMDSNTLKEVLLYHAATVRNPTCDMKDDSVLNTTLEGAILRINMFDSIPFFAGLDSRTTVQCASLVHTDGKACHAVAHEVDKLLIPPKSSILKLISENPELSTFRKIMENTDVEKDLEYQLEQQANSGLGYTLLAPNDEAFSKLEEQKLTKLLTDKKFADLTIRKHILQEPLCCSGITASPWPFTNSVQTLQGRKLDVNRNRNNQVLFGSSVAVKCDVMATDGILHIIDKVLIPQTTTRPKLGNVVFEAPGKEIMLFGI